MLDVSRQDIETYLFEVKKAIKEGNYRIARNKNRLENLNLFLDYVIDEAKAKVSSGQMSFEEAARTYSEDRGTKYNGGAMGWLLYSEAFQLLDAKIVETLFALPVDGVTDVLETERGYHVFKVTAKEAAGIPKYDDKIDPEQSVTFGDSVKDQMRTMKMYGNYNTALQELSKKLREEADIKYFDEDLD